MNSAPASPTPRRGAHSATRDCPLLARLPETSAGRLTDARQPALVSATPAIAYRVDGPSVDSRLVRSINAELECEEKMPFIERPSEGPSRQLPAPHVHQRTWRVDPASSAARRASKVLPNSNLFSIHSSNLDDAIEPLARFVMLFVLVTIAGTTVLMAGKTNRSEPDATPPAAATTGPLLEPTTVIEPVQRVVEQPVAASTATGPLGKAGVPSQERTDTLPAFPDVFAPAVDASSEQAEVKSEQITSGPPIKESRPATSAEEFLISPLTGGGRALPQVQTTEPPKAVAHLPGYILELHSRQASNDDKPSVY